MQACVAVLLLILALLPGCSAIKIAYNQADFIAAWMADDYFDLNSDQKEALRGHLDRFHAWHRSTQLAEYAALLESAQKRLDTGVGPADAVWAIDMIKAQYRPLVQRGYADAARVLSTLSEQQLSATRRQFEKNNQKYAKQYGVGTPADEQRRLRAKRNLERIEHWTGPLTPAQEARVAELSRALPLVTDLRQLDRMHRQREFLALLDGRTNVEAFAPKLRDWLINWDRTRTPEYDAALGRFVDASAKMYVEVIALLTAEQRNHISERLQRYITVFRALANEAPKTALGDK